MSVRSRIIGRRTLAALVSAGMVTTGVVAAPSTIVAPAFAQPAGTAAAAGELTTDTASVAAGATIAVSGTGFEARTAGQSLAVDLMRLEGTTKTRVSLPATTEGSSFDEMKKREGEEIYYGMITAEDSLPTAATDGTFRFEAKLPADLAAGTYALVVKGGKFGVNAPAVMKLLKFTVTAEATSTAKPKAFFGHPDEPNIEYTSQNSTVVGTFTGLPEGTKVTAVGVLDADGETISESWMPEGDYVAGADGEVIVNSIIIPATAPLGAAISATFETPSGEKLTATARRNGVTPAVGEMSPEKIKVLAEQSAPGGLYQSVFVPKTKDLFATTTSFYTGDSALLKLNSSSLSNTELVSIPKSGDDKTAPGAVFGIGYDAKHDMLWTTNTRGPSVTLYTTAGTKVATLPLENMVDGKNKAHPRDVVIDEATGKAYVSDAAGPGGKIFVYDTNTVTDGAAPESVISIPEFGDRGPMEIVLDKDNHTLWTVGFNGKYLAKVELSEGNKVTAYSLDNADVHGNRGAGVAVDTKRGLVYAASQEPSHVKVFDIKQEKVIDTIVTGASPLDALYDPVKDLVYVVNRLSGTVSVIDAESRAVVAVRSVAPYPNQLSTDGEGNVFVTTKAYLGRYPVGSKYSADTIYKVTFDKEDKNPGGGTTPDDPAKNDGSSQGGSFGSSDKDKDKDQDKNKDGSSEGSSSGVAPFVGIAAVLASLIGAICWAMKSGFLPHIPGLPQH